MSIIPWAFRAFFVSEKPGKGALRVRKKRAAAKRRTTKGTTRTRRTTTRQSSNPFLLFDIIGVALIVFGVVTLVALCAENSSGVFGRYITAAMRVMVGVGAYIIPFLLALLGAMMTVGPLKIIPRNIGIGSSMLFLVVITWASLTAKIKIPADEIVVSQTGGYIGDGLGFVLSRATGNLISYILLAAIGIIAVIIIVDVPLANLIDKIRNAWIEWKEASDERAAEVNPPKGKLAKQTEDEAVEKSRNRTLSNIFGKDKPEAKERELPVIQTAEPVAKVVPPLFKVEKAIKGEDSKPVEHGEFILPPTTLLLEPPPPPPRVESELKNNIEIIERTLEDFKVSANVVEIACGPTVARYEIRLAAGIKVNKIVGLADNLAMQLAAIDVRVEAPIPGKAAIGVEVPNRNRAIVMLRDIIESKSFREAPGKLTFALGKDVSGKPMMADLARMPHMLVGGATNAGKSVGLNTLIASLLFRATPDELKLVLIDPKRVELTLFDGIPHLACPVVKDVKMAAGVFRAVVQEMEKRYDLFARVGARNIDAYNEKVPPDEHMPFMVVVVDELCDLMMQCAAEIEGSITRLAQLARATGIHLVIATQRPSVDVITGIIKANIPSRIAFAVSSHHDSRTILDAKGAERLIGRGDMLFLPIDANKPVRIQGCYISENEIDALVKFLKDQRKPIYTIQPGQVPGSSGGDNGAADEGPADEFYEPSIRFVVNTGYCSTSMLQRKFKIGYTRAARIVDTMEQQGIVGALDGAKPRQVLINKADLESLFGGPIGMRSDDFDEEVPPAEEIRYEEEED